MCLSVDNMRWCTFFGLADIYLADVTQNILFFVKFFCNSYIWVIYICEITRIIAGTTTTSAWIWSFTSNFSDNILILLRSELILVKNDCMHPIYILFFFFVLFLLISITISWGLLGASHRRSYDVSDFWSLLWKVSSEIHFFPYKTKENNVIFFLNI